MVWYQILSCRLVTSIYLWILHFQKLKSSVFYFSFQIRNSFCNKLQKASFTLRAQNPKL